MMVKRPDLYIGRTNSDSIGYLRVSMERLNIVFIFGIVMVVFSMSFFSV